MAPPLEIGLLTPACRGHNAVDSGLAAHFADLAAGLAELGHTVRVIATDASPRLPALQAELAAVSFLTVPVTMPAWLQRLTAWHWPLHTLAGRRLAIRRAARALRLAHAARPFHCLETDSSGLLALEYLRTSPRPPVVTRVATTTAQLVAHGGGRPRWHERVLQRWERHLVCESEMVITHTNEHRREIAREFGLETDRVGLIALGIALPAYDELPPPAPADRPLRLLYVGRFEHRKGIDTLLAALPAVLFAVPTVTCMLVGQDYGGYWQQRFWTDHPGLDRHRVTFAGRIDAAQLRAAYRECDVFVAPSRYESFGLIYVEAMAWGKPVVGCRAGGVPEVVTDGETGLLTEPGDVDDLRAKLIRFLNEPSLRIRMGQAGRARVQIHFSRATLARHSAELYAELAARYRHAA
jgi:glycosyltransferase involved in cell wall biosynthesis